MFTRAAAEAALALLLGGALATRGVAGLTRPWEWLVPYLAVFLALELTLKKRKGGAALLFTWGVAFAFFYEGVYTKSVLDGLGFLGAETGALAAATFDWGMLAVIAAHLVARRKPRKEGEEDPGFLAMVPGGSVLLFLGFCMALVYLVKTWFGHYIVERALGPTWLITDILFCWLAWYLGRHALKADAAEPARWMYLLCAFAVAAPGAQALFTWADRFVWPGPFTFLMVSSWLAVCGWGYWRLWRWRGVVAEETVTDSSFILYAAAWRVAGSVAIVLAYHPAVFDERAAEAYSLLIDLPSRALFSYAFLTSRLDV